MKFSYRSGSVALVPLLIIVISSAAFITVAWYAWPTLTKKSSTSTTNTSTTAGTYSRVDSKYFPIKEWGVEFSLIISDLQDPIYNVDADNSVATFSTKVLAAAGCDAKSAAIGGIYRYATAKTEGPGDLIATIDGKYYYYFPAQEACSDNAETIVLQQDGKLKFAQSVATLQKITASSEWGTYTSSDKMFTLQYPPTRTVTVDGSEYIIEALDGSYPNPVLSISSSDRQQILADVISQDYSETPINHNGIEGTRFLENGEIEGVILNDFYTYQGKSYLFRGIDSEENRKIFDSFMFVK